MKRKRMIIFAIILMAVGFAAVSTTLYLNGAVGVRINLDDFDVYFSGAILDGVDMSNELISDKKQINFTSKELKSVGSKSILKYEVTNGSKQYDAEARITCTEIDNPNVRVTLDKYTFTILSGKKETGTITMEMVRAVTEEESIEFSCSITASALERNSIGDEVKEVEAYSLSGTLIDEDGNKIANENLVIYSEKPQYVTTDKNGFFYVNGLERGIHEIYNVGSVDAKDKTKEEIKEISTGIVRVSTNNDKDEIELSNNYKIINLKVTNEKIVEYTLTYDNAGGSGCTYTKAVIGQMWDTSCVPTKSGYTFIGWIGVPESVTGNATAIASWEALGVNLYNLMKASAKSDTIDFKVNSGTSGTNGIYTTTATERGVPVYYYRGSANQVNNNIIFNNMCWKIVRTTETGGVKLIYNGTPTDGKCTGTNAQIGESVFNTSLDDNAYVGYMYGTPRSSTYAATHANTNNSTIKTYIDNWYRTNFDETTTSKLEDTVFCNDRSTTTGTNNNILGSDHGSLGYARNLTAYGTAARSSYYTTNLNPSLVCANANDKFTVSSTNGNGKLSYPVGLITLDELVFAGYNKSSSNTSKDTANYLHTGLHYWTLSPVVFDSRWNAVVGIVNGDDGYICNNGVHNTYGVRPVVSLISGTLVTGDGSSTNPYVVK